MKLILTVGIPGSGKSTWARETAAERYGLWGGLLVLERDEIRRELTGDIRNHSREVEVTRIQHDRAREALLRGVNVVIADTNLKSKYRQPWARLAAETGAEYVVHVIDTPLEVCVERDAQRPNPVGREVIERMHTLLKGVNRAG